MRARALIPTAQSEFTIAPLRRFPPLREGNQAARRAERERLLREQERRRAEAERLLREQAERRIEQERLLREQAERRLAELEAELKRLRGEP